MLNCPIAKPSKQGHRYERLHREDRGRGHATAIHHPSGHIFEFSIAPTAPHIRGGIVRENQKAERGPDSLWGAARDAVLLEARAADLIPK
jgi:hypothetical protein